MSDTNVTTHELAADMAWDAIKAWHIARDKSPTVTAEDVRELAGDARSGDAYELARSLCQSAGCPDAAKLVGLG